MSGRHRVLVMLALAGCSNSGAPSSPSAPTVNPRLTARTQAVAVTISIPNPGTRNPNQRHREFISPGTASASLSIDGFPPNIYLDLGSGAPGCSAGATARTCVETVSLPLGQHTISVSTFDGQLGSAGPTGAALGIGTSQVTIVEGRANAVSISILGIPASMTLSLAQSMLTSLAKPITDAVTYHVYDAAGDEITGADTYADPISFAFHASNAGFGTSATIDVNGVAGANATVPGDAVTVQYPGRYGSNQLALVASIDYGNTVIGSVPLTIVPGIVKRAIAGHQIGAGDIAQDSYTGNVWITEPARAALGESASSGTFSEFTLLSGKAPQRIVATDETTAQFGVSFYIAESGTTIGAVAPTGTVSETVAPTQNPGIEGIAAIYITGGAIFAEQTAAKIGMISASGTISETPVAIAGSAPAFTAIDPDSGAYLFTDPGTNSLGLDLKGAIDEFPIPIADAKPGKIIDLDSANAWFAQAGASDLGHYDNQSTITEYPMSAPIADLASGATDGFAALWAVTSKGAILAIDSSGHATAITDLLASGGTPFAISENTGVFVLRNQSTGEIDEVVY